MGNAHISFASPTGIEGISVLLQVSNKYLVAPWPSLARSRRDHPSRPLVSTSVSTYMENMVPRHMRYNVDPLEQALDPRAAYGQGTVSALLPQSCEARVLVQYMEPNKWLLQRCSEPWAAIASFRSGEGGSVTGGDIHLWRDETIVSLGKHHPIFNVHMTSNIFLHPGVCFRPPEKSWHKHLYCRSVVCQKTSPVSQQPAGHLCAGTVMDLGGAVAQTAAELFLSLLMPSGKLRRLLCC